MSTISGSTSSTTPAEAAAAASAAAQAALQEASQSLISGVTGDTSMDVSTIVTALVDSKVAGQQAALETEVSNDDTQISAIGQLSAALSQLQVGLSPLFNGDIASTFNATVSGSGLSATASTGAASGAYTVDVSQIAQAQSLTSGAFSSSDAADMGTGTLTISVGGQSMSLDITSSNDTLSDIASAIRSSSDNPGITASVITGSNGTEYLSLDSSETGASNVINVSVSNTTSSSSPLVNLGVTSTAGATSSSGSSSTASSITSTSGAWTQNTAAQDAMLTINGIAASSSSNTVSGVLSGVTLTLGQSTSTTTPYTLSVAPNTSTMESDIETFVSDYNTVISTVASLTSFNSSGAAGSQGGPLLGSTMVNQIQATFGVIVGSSVTSGGITATLAQLGISLNPTSGTLTISDPTTLDNAVTSDPAQVEALFNSTNGIGQQLNAQITSFTQSGGIIDDTESTISTNLQSVTSQTTSLQTYIQQLTSQYTDEFTSLNDLMTTTNNESQYLTALFGGANSSGTLNSSSS
ncbi:flagellar hook protein FliD [Burkholderia sp. WAC0059]|uniref:flagellar filament capping protein FliD n=1 Tax=Burkholderia sp. WAC0059 TaxID=2066022 RepID=UPI000C7F07F7|nr:flagellar filament capping protein FliD [Burkholderia sp. WAC0059]PLZ01904.1 flagellar hook protein FliD [Burkholderia sp. WAC0059]